MEPADHHPAVATRSRVRIGVYALVSAVGLVSLALYFSGWFGFRTSNGIVDTDSVNVADTREKFNQLYQISWRVDGGAGNIAAEGVYYFPELIMALETHSERSPLQALTRQELAEHASEADLYPFVIHLEGNSSIDQLFPFHKHARLTVNGTDEYTIEQWQPFQQTAGIANSLDGIAWFRRPGDAAEPRRFELVVQDLPESKRAAVLSWDLAALGLSQTTASSD